MQSISKKKNLSEALGVQPLFNETMGEINKVRKGKKIIDELSLDSFDSLEYIYIPKCPFNESSKIIYNQQNCVLWVIYRDIVLSLIHQYIHQYIHHNFYVRPTLRLRRPVFWHLGFGSLEFS